MPQVRPFPGLRFNPARVGELSAALSPPYDIVSPEEQALYYRRSPYNVIRLELPTPGPGHSRGDRYRRAARTFRDWLREGVLLPEDRPALYLIEHRFPYGGSTRSRWGLIARVRLEEWEAGHIRPHEAILRAPAADRYRLLQACRANFSPVMGIFRGRLGLPALLPGAAGRPADFSATDNYGVTYDGRVVTEPAAVRRVARFLARKAIYIADGHHRYSMALAYMKERRARARRYTGREPFNFVMMALMAAADPGVITMPTHRLVRVIDHEALSRLEAGLDSHFREVARLPARPTLSETAQAWQEALDSRGPGVLGLYRQPGGQLRLLAVRDRANLQGLLPPEQPAAWRELDVSLLHWVVLRGLLGIATPEQEEACLEFPRDPVEAISRVDTGEFQVAFLLSPIPLDSLFAIADARGRMPQKSTYFYPKTASGLVINPLF